MQQKIPVTIKFVRILRGYLCLLTVGVTMIVLDLVQRTAIVALVALFPPRRPVILNGWMQFVAGFLLHLAAIGGARIGAIPKIPPSPSTFVMMNHQSLLDIPVAVRSVAPSFLKIVTRRTYARGVPIVSHMLRLYGFPVVDPVRFSKSQLDSLSRLTINPDNPIGIFPEGTRTRDGQIGRFRTAGSAAILASRPWSVYLLVLDGFWRCGRLQDFASGIGLVDAKFSRVGPFPFDPVRDDIDAFLEDMRNRMIDELARLRAEPAS